MARLAAVAAVIILAAGCTSAASHAPAPSASPARTTTTRFIQGGLTFSYPAAWQAATWNDDVSDFSYVMVALSTTAQHDPCVTSVTVGGARIISICREPVAALPPGKLLVMWTVQGFPNWHEPVMTTTVGGRPASETRVMESWCKGLGGTQTITVVIPRSLADNWYQMDACLRGPGLTGTEGQVSAMLRSVRIAKGW